MGKYRKQPVVIEAFQLTAETRLDNRDWPNWLNEAWNKNRNDPGSVSPWVAGDSDGALRIETLEGTHMCRYEDWIIRGVNGELYPCKPDIFAKTYEAVEDAAKFGGATLARNQPCGCVVCCCENDDQCQGCGAKHCGTHEVGKLPNPKFGGA